MFQHKLERHHIMLSDRYVEGTAEHHVSGEYIFMPGNRNLLSQVFVALQKMIDWTLEQQCNFVYDIETRWSYIGYTYNPNEVHITWKGCVGFVPHPSSRLSLTVSDMLQFLRDIETEP